MLTMIFGLNLVALGIVEAQSMADQTGQLTISSGSLDFSVPASINFGRKIIAPTDEDILNSLDGVVTTDPNTTSAADTIRVIDNQNGNTFKVDISVENLQSSSIQTISYHNIGILTVADSTSDTVDATYNNPSGTNNVVALVDYNQPYQTTSEIPDTVGPSDAFNYFTGSGAQSDFITLLQRTVPGNAPAIGVYSVAPIFRVKIPSGTNPTTFTSNITFSFYVPYI